MGFGEYPSLAPAPPQARVGGRSVPLIPARAADLGPDALPADYQPLLTIVRDAAGPVTVRTVGEVLGLPVEVRGKPEPPRANRAPVEHGFAALKNWRIPTRLRLNPTRAVNLLRALLVLTNLETSR